MSTEKCGEDSPLPMVAIWQSSQSEPVAGWLGLLLCSASKENERETKKALISSDRLAKSEKKTLWL